MGATSTSIEAQPAASRRHLPHTPRAVVVRSSHCVETPTLRCAGRYSRLREGVARPWAAILLFTRFLPFHRSSGFSGLLIEDERHDRVWVPGTLGVVSLRPGRPAVSGGNGNRYLPGKDAVLAACRGFPLAENPVLDSACQLANVYESHTNLLLGVDDIIERERYHELRPIMDWAELIDTVVYDRRARLVSSIDEWVEIVVPAASPTAPMHVETVGNIIDRLALLTIRSYVAMANAPDAVARAVHAQLYIDAAAYGDLTRVLAAGLKRLPFNHRPAEIWPR